MIYTTVINYSVIIKDLIDYDSPIDYKNLADYTSFIIQKVIIEVIIIFIIGVFAIYINDIEKVAI